MTPELSKKKNPYQDIFSQFIEAEAEQSPLWVTQLRESAISSFDRLGFPTVADEEWKYTNLAPIAKQPFSLGTPCDPATAGKLIPFYPEAENLKLVFLNGIFSPELSTLREVPRGLVVCNLAEAFTAYGDLLQKHLTGYANPETDAFTALNTAFIKAGALILIPRGCLVESPINLFFVSDHSSDFSASFPRVLILGGTASCATVIENYIPLDDESGRFGNRPYLTNAVTEIVLEDAAVLNHYKLQKESLNAFHIANTQVSLGQSSVFTGHSIAFGGQLSRNRIDVNFTAEGGECHLNGLYYVAGKQVTDSHIMIDHAHPHCTSNLLYKGMLDDKARGVFNGKVFVRKDAQGTNALQTNKNLLLSTSARVDTKPQLEIFADDVKCGHGATVGQLDNEEIFYLLSRGLDHSTARKLLTYGFAEEVIEKIAIESIKSSLDRNIATRILEHIGER